MATYLISYSILDGKGKTGSLPIRIPAGALTIAQVQAYAQDLAEFVDNVSSGQITGISVTLSADLPGGLKTSPGEYCDIEEGGLFTFANGTPYVDSPRVPAFLETLFTGENIDLTPNDPADLFAKALYNGITEGANTIVASDKYENEYTGLVKATKSFRK